jgi:hypothetical protein
LKVRELAKNTNLTADELINELIKPASKSVWFNCQLCGVWVKAGNMVNHMSRVQLKTIRRWWCDLIGQIRVWMQENLYSGNIAIP